MMDFSNIWSQGAIEFRIFFFPYISRSAMGSVAHEGFFSWSDAQQSTIQKCFQAIKIVLLPTCCSSFGVLSSYSFFPCASEKKWLTTFAEKKKQKIQIQKKLYKLRINVMYMKYMYVYIYIYYRKWCLCAMMRNMFQILADLLNNFLSKIYKIPKHTNDLFSFISDSGTYL